MGMGIGINSERPDEGKVRGWQEPVACYVWFTSEGKAIPKRLKYLDTEGCVQEIKGIHVISSSEKNYCGIPTVEYDCNCIIGNRKYAFRLLYYLERHIWKLLWK